jgi:hypothetical protein
MNRDVKLQKRFEYIIQWSPSRPSKAYSKVRATMDGCSTDDEVVNESKATHVKRSEFIELQSKLEQIEEMKIHVNKAVAQFDQLFLDDLFSSGSDNEDDVDLPANTPMLDWMSKVKQGQFIGSQEVGEAAEQFRLYTAYKPGIRSQQEMDAHAAEQFRLYTEYKPGSVGDESPLHGPDATTNSGGDFRDQMQARSPGSTVDSNSTQSPAIASFYSGEAVSNALKALDYHHLQTHQPTHVPTNNPHTGDSAPDAAPIPYGHTVKVQQQRREVLEQDIGSDPALTEEWLALLLHQSSDPSAPSAVQPLASTFSSPPPTISASASPPTVQQMSAATASKQQTPKTHAHSAFDERTPSGKSTLGSPHEEDGVEVVHPPAPTPAPAPAPLEVRRALQFVQQQTEPEPTPRPVGLRLPTNVNSSNSKKSPTRPRFNSAPAKSTPSNTRWNALTKGVMSGTSMLKTNMLSKFGKDKTNGLVSASLCFHSLFGMLV